MSSVMMFKTHMAFAFLLGLLFVSFLQIRNQILFMIIILMGASMPDIDLYKSKAGEKIKPISFIINLIFKHRGFFHSIYPPIIIYLFFVAFNQSVLGLAIMVGYISHLALDSLTLLGIQPLWPLKKGLRGFLKTGTKVDYVLFVIFCILGISLLFRIPITG
jgi:inner membrane protein